MANPQLPSLAQQENDTIKALGSLIRELRLERHWMQSDLAVACQIDTSYISLLERFKRNPSLSITIRIAYAFELIPSEFVEMILKRAIHLQSERNRTTQATRTEQSRRRAVG